MNDNSLITENSDFSDSLKGKTKAIRRGDVSPQLLLFVILLSISCFYSNLARDSYMDDFRAFYVASLAAHDHLDPYFNHVDLNEKYADAQWTRKDSRFIYPPSAIFFFSPLAKLNYKWSKIAFGTTMSLLMVGILCGLHRRYPHQTVVLLALFLTLPMFMNIDNGNIDILILALTLASFYLEDGLAGGICLGVAISIKFAPLLLILWFISQERWRTAVWGLFTSGALGLLALYRWGIGYYRSFLDHLLHHGAVGMPTVSHVFSTIKIFHDRAIMSADGFYAFQHDIGGYAQNPLRFVGSLGGALGVALPIGFVIWLVAGKAGREMGRERSFFLFLVVALLANTLLWAMALVACFPLVVLLVNESDTPRKTALLLLVPLFLTRQLIGQNSFLLWLVAAAYCMHANGWFSSARKNGDVEWQCDPRNADELVLG